MDRISRCRCMQMMWSFFFLLCTDLQLSLDRYAAKCEAAGLRTFNHQVWSYIQVHKVLRDVLYLVYYLVNVGPTTTGLLTKSWSYVSLRISLKLPLSHWFGLPYFVKRNTPGFPHFRLNRLIVFSKPALWERSQVWLGAHAPPALLGAHGMEWKVTEPATL